MAGHVFYVTPACAESLERALAQPAPGAHAKVVGLAVQASRCSVTRGIAPAGRLAVIDYSLPSTEPRLWVFDLDSRTLLFRELVAHGRNSGDNFTKRFSNADESRSSSVGMYRTMSPHTGHNGYSLRMQGLEPGFNDHAIEREIVIHGAPYVSADMAKAHGRIGRIGRTWGCPVVRPAVAHRLIDAMKEGQLMFSYYPDARWLNPSTYLNCSGVSKRKAAQTRR